MEIQFHPASGGAKVRTFRLGPTGERWLAFLAGAAALLAASMLLTVPVVITRAGRREDRSQALGGSAEAGARRERVLRLAREIRERALDRADYLNRVALVYGVPAARWPRALSSNAGTASATEAGRIAAGVEVFLPALERGRAILEERERLDPDLPARAPSVLPCAVALCEPSSFFGPRTSPWTGGEEFFPGVDIAAPEGSAVLAPGGATVVFAGRAQRSSTGRFWRLGNMIVLSHGASGATVLGHLSRIDVRRGQRVGRGQRIGAVGGTGWAISPQLHYEYWRPDGGTLRPTDPLFAALDRRLGRKPVPLEQMEATSAPGPLDPLPGLGAPVSGSPRAPAAGSRPAPARKRRST
jgi:murein DD-endopeptidase MepM/ murein hydrolase activator NlpD